MFNTYADGCQDKNHIRQDSAVVESVNWKGLIKIIFPGFLFTPHEKYEWLSNFVALIYCDEFLDLILFVRFFKNEQLFRPSTDRDGVNRCLAR